MDGDLMAEAQPAFCLDRQTANRQTHTHTQKRKKKNRNSVDMHFTQSVIIQRGC